MARPAVTKAQRAAARALQQELRARFDELGIGMEELARRSRVNRRTLDLYFNGDSPSPSFFLILAVSRGLGLGLERLSGAIDAAS